MQVTIVSKFVSTLARRNLSFFHLQDDLIKRGMQSYPIRAVGQQVAVAATRRWR
jgi:hypothetical protein